MTKPGPVLTGEELKAWPFNGYGPGEYFGTCSRCGGVKPKLDKRAVTCLECAVIMSKEATRAQPPSSLFSTLVEGLHAQIFGIHSLDDPALSHAALADGGAIHEAAHQLVRALPARAQPPSLGTAKEILAATSHDKNCAMLLSLTSDYCDCTRTHRAIEAALLRGGEDGVEGALRDVVDAIGEWSRPTGANGMIPAGEDHPLCIAARKARQALAAIGERGSR